MIIKSFLAEAIVTRLIFFQIIYKYYSVSLRIVDRGRAVDLLLPIVRNSTDFLHAVN